ncbi:hypothetical protein ACF0H5_017838 [Mactra antiquata]
MDIKILFLFCVNILCKVSVESVNVPGDVTIVGLFNIWKMENGKCSNNIDVNSVMITEAVKWYITQINKHGGLFFDIGFKAFATCGLPSEAGKLTVDILCDNNPHNNSVIGIIGPELSSESVVTSSIISSLPEDEMLAQISFSATDALLGNKTKYKNLIRVVPNNDVEIEAMILSMLKLKWNRISIMFEESEYGRDGANRLQDKAEKNDICVSELYSINIDGGVDVGQVSSILNSIMFGTDVRPASTGIVLFATSSTINTILLSMSAINISPVPIVMVSDGLNMNVNELLRPSDNGLDVIPEAKGMLALTPPYFEISEFSEHWRNILTNITVFTEESLTNPYIKDVYDSFAPCSETVCGFRPLSQFSIQPLYLQYALVATHALISSFNTRVKSYCPDDATLCEDFKETFLPMELIESMKGMTLNFKEDFNWGLDSMSNNSNIWKLDSSGELLHAEDQPKYELYNFKDDKSDFSDQFTLVKVGEYVESDMNIQYDKLRDYTISGEVSTWPDIRKALCPSGKSCFDCLENQQLHEAVYLKPGDRYVVGVAPVYNTDANLGCGAIRTYPGYQAAEAMKYVVENINSKSSTYSSYFPGINIGLIILNSCNNPVVIQRKIYQLHYTGVKLPNGETFILDVDKVIGYIGEVNSDITIAMAEALTRLPFVQISYGSTSDKLSDRYRYPHFMRVVTPVTPQSKAIIEVVKHINSDYIQIVHSDTEYGNNGKDSIVDAAIDNSICVIQKIPVHENFNEFEIYDKLRRFPHARVVVVILQSYKILRLVKAILSQMDRGEFTFIGSQTWHHTKNLLDADSRQLLLGSYSLAFEIKQDERLLQRVRSLTPQPFSSDPWVTSFLQARGNCHYQDSFDKRSSVQCSNDSTNYQLDYLDTYVVLATTGLLTGANSFLHKTCLFNDFKMCPPLTENVNGLMEEVRKVKLDVDGSGLESRIFNQNNDGNIGFRIYKIQKDPFNTSKMQYAMVGRYSLDGNFDFTDDEVNVKSSCPNKLACKNCGLTEDIELKEDIDDKT